MGLKILAILVVSALFLAACTPNNQKSSQNSSVESSQNVQEGNKAPNFTLESFTGESVSLADFRGKAVLIDFWAAWCPFCIKEMPEIEKISQEFASDLVILGVHRTETEEVETGQKFADKTGVTYQLLKDTDGELFDTLGKGQTAMPLALFIDKEGNVTKILFGPKTEDQMRENVEKII